MQFQIIGKSIVTLEHKKGESTSRHICTEVNFGVSDNIDTSGFIDEKEELPNEAGTKALTQCFVQGLISNIHSAEERGYWNSAEHLRYIIAELERGFATVAITHYKDSDSE